MPRTPFSSLGARPVGGPVDDAAVVAMPAMRDVAERIRTGAGEGDLLLKGTYFDDHLVRVALQYTHDVRCWKDDCRKRLTCSLCASLGPPR